MMYGVVSVAKKVQSIPLHHPTTASLKFVRNLALDEVIRASLFQGRIPKLASDWDAALSVSVSR